MTISEYLRMLVEKHVEAPKVDSWKIVIWSLFDVNLTKVNYGLARSESPQEFFSYIANYINKSKFGIKPTMDGKSIIFTIGEHDYTIRIPEEMSVYESIGTVVEELESRIMEDYDEKEKV